MQTEGSGGGGIRAGSARGGEAPGRARGALRRAASVGRGDPIQPPAAPGGRRVRIGCGAGFSNDRIDPARDLAERGGLDFLFFECLAERTLANAHALRAADPKAGYDPWLRKRMEAVLRPCREAGTRVVSNMGSANPAAAGEAVAEVARALGLQGPRTWS